MNEPWRILIVDDEDQNAKLVAASIRSAARNESGKDPIVDIEPGFDVAMARLAAHRFDLLILDVRDQPTATLDAESIPPFPGINVFDNIRDHRFIPIIFYSAVPAEVQSHNNPPFVQVVSKIAEDPVRELREAVTLAFKSDFPRIYRVLEDHSAAVTRDFMIDFVEKNWDTLSDNRDDMMHLLLRHLIASLGRGASEMTAMLGYGTEDLADDTVHASRYYTALPSSEYATGDVLRSSQSLPTNDDGGDSDRWYVIVTPSCDLLESRRPRRAEYVVLVQCRPLSSFPEHMKLANTESEDSRLNERSERIKSLLRSNPYRQQPDRYHYLPAAWTVPDLIVDNQVVVSVPYDDLAKHYNKVASLDSPFAEALVNRFARFIGRLGTPDLDLDAIVARWVGQ